MQLPALEVDSFASCLSARCVLRLALCPFSFSFHCCGLQVEGVVWNVLLVDVAVYTVPACYPIVSNIENV